jgi:hypothetical protein
VCKRRRDDRLHLRRGLRLSDSFEEVSNARSGKEANACAQKCVKAGWDPVFIVDGKADAIKIREKDKALPFVGEHVTVDGKLVNGVLTVTTVRKKP